MMFSPVWFPVRQVDLKPGQKTIQLPVENRYSFTNLSDLKFTWEFDKQNGSIKAIVPPLSKGNIEIPLPDGAANGSLVDIRVTDSKGRLINAMALALGKPKASSVPQVDAGAPKWNDDGKSVTIEGKSFSLVLNKTTGDLDAANPRQKTALLQFPALHISRYDFGDLANPAPYALLPDAAGRVIDKVSVAQTAGGLELTVQDHYKDFAGSVTWLIDKRGIGKVSYSYAYSGEELNAREIGVKAALKAECDTLKWNRWSEWGIFPEDSISRTKGTAKAWRAGITKPDFGGVRPNWPWSLDQTELGTADFRSIKFHIYEASLTAKNGTGVKVHANADAHIRACVAEKKIMMHLISKCRMGQYIIKSGDSVSGSFVVQLL